jgi:hypothetical protein
MTGPSHQQMILLSDILMYGRTRCGALTPIVKLLMTHGVRSDTLLSPLTSPFNGDTIKGAAVKGTDVRHPFQVQFIQRSINPETISRRVVFDNRLQYFILPNLHIPHHQFHFATLTTLKSINMPRMTPQE